MEILITVHAFIILTFPSTQWFPTFFARAPLYHL